MAKQIINKKPTQASPTTSLKKVKSIYNLLLKLITFSAIIVLIIAFTDYKGYFNPDYSNDHTRRKWNSYYEFTKQNPVDVVLVGNSHLYTGISPENLSTALGANCFILASPGTTMTDTYFCLKEAISVSKPKIAIVETFTLNDYDSYQLKAGTLSDQFKSFSARKNIAQKLISTPFLFKSSSYLPAWSNTLRNHSFIFTDTMQLHRNIQLSNVEEAKSQGLYLGRYIRFTSGIEDSTLLKYDKPGFVAYDYAQNLASEEAKKYLMKTVELCKANDIQLVLLTLPMYYKHVHNYETYKKDLVSTLANAPYHWLDLQLPYDTAAYTPACFENTVNSNQHITYYGSCVSAYKLANYIKSTIPKALPNRYAETSWKQMFYATDGYFENYVPENDGVSQILLQDKLTSDGMQIKEISLVPYANAKKLIMKVAKTDAPTMQGKKALVRALVVLNSQAQAYDIELKCTYGYDPLNHYVFESEGMNPAFTIQEINGINFKLSN